MLKWGDAYLVALISGVYAFGAGFMLGFPILYRDDNVLPYPPVPVALYFSVPYAFGAGLSLRAPFPVLPDSVNAGEALVVEPVRGS